MFIYTLRRLLLAIPTLLGITIITFSVISLAPGDPAQIAAMNTGGTISSDMSQESWEMLRKQYNLDKPIMVRYWYWLAGEPKRYNEAGEVVNKDRSKGILRGDFGRSMSSDPKPVLEKIRSRLWPTMSLAILAIGSSLAFAVPLGVVAAVKQNSVFDRVSSTILYALYSIPSYVMALPLLLLFCIKLKWLPFGGIRSENFDDLTAMGQIWDYAKHYIIITFCTSYGAWAFYSRFVRQNMLEVLKQDYIRTARSKGLDERTIVVKHAFRNALIPIVTLLGMMLPALIGGSVILEQIFDWPGMGRMMFEAIMTRDYSMIMGMTLITATLVMTGTLLADLSYGLVDPRVKYD